MWNSLAAIERSHGFLNAGDLPLVQVEVLVYRLSGEERSAPPGTLGQFLQSLLAGRINANADGCRGQVLHTSRLCLIVYMLAQIGHPANIWVRSLVYWELFGWLIFRRRTPGRPGFHG